MKIHALTHSEEILMNILWKLNSAYMKDVMAAYPEPKPHQNTVSTFMKILVDKEFLTTEKEGRIFKYTVAIPYSSYRNFVLANFMHTYFNNSGAELVEYLLEEQWLTPSELKVISAAKNSEKSSTADKTDPVKEFVEEITAESKAKKKEKKKEKKKKK